MNEIGTRLADLDPNFKKISFNSDDSAVAMLSEAATLTLQAVHNAVKRKKTKSVEAMERLVLRDGPSPGVNFDKGVLTITVTPGLGIAGRPSSEKIARALR
jgi:hypothetical protein